MNHIANKHAFLADLPGGATKSMPTSFRKPPPTEICSKLAAKEFRLQGQASSALCGSLGQTLKSSISGAAPAPTTTFWPRSTSGEAARKTSLVPPSSATSSSSSISDLTTMGLQSKENKPKLSCRFLHGNGVQDLHFLKGVVVAMASNDLEPNPRLLLAGREDWEPTCTDAAGRQVGDSQDGPRIGGLLACATSWEI
ncbi:hypothetical protein BDK51DRAFT_39159 [Blyttiomyces helicus]|uniref:Uncharacterized protein n=1 Tax=Blyttiomyces helicus TaxID=388810 RepID=A0A4P9W6S2_9FUNG|nr:hypothetical protein BDK51DRAFT_39159 [Blyttiomyces helicus]|eukprot:RKO88034.1 hypothetical protein BDK51DRAFT_39159 [Blyttiomyces helicus]